MVRAVPAVITDMISSILTSRKYILYLANTPVIVTHIRKLPTLTYSSLEEVHDIRTAKISTSFVAYAYAQLSVCQASKVPTVAEFRCLCTNLAQLQGC